MLYHSLPSSIIPPMTPYIAMYVFTYILRSTYIARSPPVLIAG